MNYLYILNLITLLITLCIGIRRFGIFDEGTKAICVYCGIVLLTETCAYIGALVYKNNLPVYSVAAMFQATALCIYFNYITDIFKARNVGLWIGGLAVIIWIVNIIFFQPIGSFPSHFIIFEATLVTVLCIFALVKELMKDETKAPAKDPHFWFISILLLVWTITLFVFAELQYVATHSPRFLPAIASTLFIVNICAYGGIGFVFYRYPKIVRT